VYTLLDAAALVSTTELDLSNTSTAPDFVALSFYKIFGFPNLGALLVKRSSAKVLMNRKFFGGGTVEMVISVNDSWASKKSHQIHSRLEDGTLPFTSIFALDLAIDVHKRIYGPSPMKTISKHTSRLIKKLYDDMTSLRHSSGIPLITVYKDPTAVYGQAKLQGATIAFNIQNPQGEIVSFAEVEKEADKQGISVRSGSLCNPGGIATYLKWSPKELRAAYDEGHRCSEPLAQVFGKPIGVVRVSLGAMSSDEDIEKFVTFVRETYLDVALSEDAKLAVPVDIACPMKQFETITDITVVSPSSEDSDRPVKKPRERPFSMLSFRELKSRSPSCEITSADDVGSIKASTIHKMKFRLMGAMRLPRRVK
jgi:molybdenum cofactor sulfurtransferase